MAGRSPSGKALSRLLTAWAFENANFETAQGAAAILDAFNQQIERSGERKLKVPLKVLAIMLKRTFLNGKDEMSLVTELRELRLRR
jgi:hypothetical protein